MPTASTFETALPEIMPNSAGAHHRDLGRAAAETAHGRHRDVGEEIGAAGARQHLAEDRERNHDQHGDCEDRADHAVDVEAEIGDQPLRRDPAGLEIARQVRADVDVDRHRQDDGDEAEARGAAARFQHQEQQDRAADDAFRSAASRARRSAARSARRCSRTARATRRRWRSRSRARTRACWRGTYRRARARGRPTAAAECRADWESGRRCRRGW